MEFLLLIGVRLHSPGGLWADDDAMITVVALGINRPRREILLQ
jgi:hypothetical protein